MIYEAISVLCEENCMEVTQSNCRDLKKYAEHKIYIGQIFVNNGCYKKQQQQNSNETGKIQAQK